MDFPRLTIDGLSPDQCAALARTRKYEQYVASVADALAGRCPFCDIDPARNRVIAENAAWRAWPSTSPEKHTRLHFIIAHKRHVERLEDVEDVDGTLFLCILRDLRRMHDLPGGGVLMRDGALQSAGTIWHLHGHLMVPDGTGRVESPFYKGDVDEMASHARAIIFEKLRSGQEITSDERALVADRL